MNTLRELYLEQLQDIYSAEQQLTVALPQMAWKARDEDLKKSFGEHLDETKGQLARLDEIFQRHPSHKPDGHLCKAMQGLIREGEEALNTSGSAEIIDAHLVACAYRIEYYEIAAYKTAISMAQALNEDEDAKVLKNSLSEEENASKLLEKTAEGGLFSRGLHQEAVSK